MKHTFGERLQKVIKQRGLTQKQLASRLNTTEATISRYITGEREPKAEMLANLATALDTTSDYLLGIESNDFDFYGVERMLCRNASEMSIEEKKKLIAALFGDN